MEHSSNHPADADARQYATANQNGGQHVAHHYPYSALENQVHHHQHQHYYNSHQTYNLNQPATWQWMPVAIPPPPPPPPPPLPPTASIPSPSLAQEQIKPQTSDDQTKRRKRRWGPSAIEQQDAIEQQTENVTSTADSKLKKEDINNSTDSAVDAINALSTLEARWEGPIKKKKNSRRKRRKKKKGNFSNTAQKSLDGDDLHNVWIDVEDVVKIINPSQSKTEKREKIEGSCDNSEGVESMGFPPLKREAKEGETERDLNAMDTSELKSYADALTRALGGAYKNQNINEEVDSEMDISDEEESSVDRPGPEIKNANVSSLEVDNEVRTSEEAAVAKDKADEDNVKREKEKRALKLAELKAKAKLANAKLRMAMQRKAMGNIPKDANGRTTPPHNSTTAQTKRQWQPGIRDISALRNIGTLIIHDVSRTGSDEMVRFIDSVYDLSSSDDDYSSEDGEEVVLPEPIKAEAAPPNNDNQKKSHKSLKQQLHLAKLRLEIKRKEQMLLEKKRKIQAIALPSNDVISTTDLTNASESRNDCNQDNAKSIDNEAASISAEEKRAKLEQLRQRQKELKQKNDVSNLKNLINRQKQLLRTQGQELTENSAQLERVASDITTKKLLLDESKRRIEEMNHRKKIMEGMMLRATEKLMTARTALNQRKERSVTT